MLPLEGQVAAVPLIVTVQPVAFEQFQSVAGAVVQKHPRPEPPDVTVVGFVHPGDG